MRKKERERERRGKGRDRPQERNERRDRPARYLFLKFSGSRPGGAFVNK